MSTTRGNPHRWTVVCAEGVDPGEPNGDSVAYATRDFVPPDPRSQLLSLTPNDSVLVLDEAWAFQCPGSSPVVADSIEQSRWILWKLLSRKLTPAQEHMRHSVSLTLNLLEEELATGSSTLRRFLLVDQMWQESDIYERLTEPGYDGTTDTQGVPVLARPLAFEHANPTLFGAHGYNMGPVGLTPGGGLVCPYELPSNLPFVVVPFSPRNLPVWESQSLSRALPAYLATLS